MRIAFLGNMNNMGYVIAKGLRGKGYDVTLLVDVPASELIDRPESFDESLKKGYPNWIINLPSSAKYRILKFSFPGLYYSRFIVELKKYDIVFLNGYWIALGHYLPKNKLVLNLFAGFDLDNLGNYEATTTILNSFTRKPVPSFILKFFIRQTITAQRKGIRRANVINYYPTGINPTGDNLIAEIKKGQQYKRLELRGFDCSVYPYKAPAISSDKFIILSVTRFFYCNDRNDNKRNDIMIKGIARFVKSNSITKGLEVCFFEKGTDTNVAKELCRKLDMDTYVQWIPEVPQHELKKYFERCDVAFDQLGEQWIGAGIFSMLTGRPLIANGRPEIFEKITHERSPICQATTEEEVEAWLTKLYTNRQLVKEIGEHSRAYILKHYSLDKTITFFELCFEDACRVIK